MIADVAEYPEDAVVRCPPGKRAGAKPRVRPDSPIAFITDTALMFPAKQSSVPTALNDRRTADERIEAAERAEAQSVALRQPHRVGSDSPSDPRLAFPLGRLCAALWRNDARFGNKMYGAGVLYAAEVRAVRIAAGFHVIGPEREKKMAAEDIDNLPPEERGRVIKEMQDNRSALEKTLEKADQVLIDVMPRCPRAMVRICFDHEEPSIYDTDVLRHGLYKLSLHYGLWDRVPV